MNEFRIQPETLTRTHSVHPKTLLATCHSLRLSPIQKRREVILEKSRVGARHNVDAVLL